MIGAVGKQNGVFSKQHGIRVPQIACKRQRWFPNKAQGNLRISYEHTWWRAESDFQPQGE